MRKILLALFAATIFQIVIIQSSSATILIVPKSNIVHSKNDPDPLKVKTAIEQFKNLSHHEKKMMLKEVNKKVREYKKEGKSKKDDEGTSTLLLVIIAILLPPLAVALHEHGINSKFWIDLLLTLLFYLPGLIYALVIILRKE